MSFCLSEKPCLWGIKWEQHRGTPEFLQSLLHVQSLVNAPLHSPMHHTTEIWRACMCGHVSPCNHTAHSTQERTQTHSFYIKIIVLTFIFTFVPLILKTCNTVPQAPSAFTVQMYPATPHTQPAHSFNSANFQCLSHIMSFLRMALRLEGHLYLGPRPCSGQLLWPRSLCRAVPSL